jgi:predicted site-specific integrase-resolvase
MEFVRTKKLSELIDIPVWSIRKLVREGKLPAYKLSEKEYLFDYDEVVETIRKLRVN